jgi:hypothetical protein
VRLKQETFHTETSRGSEFHAVRYLPRGASILSPFAACGEKARCKTAVYAPLIYSCKNNQPAYFTSIFEKLVDVSVYAIFVSYLQQDVLVIICRK